MALFVPERRLLLITELAVLQRVTQTVPIYIPRAWPILMILINIEKFRECRKPSVIIKISTKLNKSDDKGKQLIILSSI